MWVIDWKRTCGSPIECSRRRSKRLSGVAAPAAISPPCVVGRMRDLIKRPGRGAPEPLTPGRGAVYPPPADHGRDDLDLPERGRLDGEGIAVEHDEVGEEAGQQTAAAALVAGKPRGRDARRRDRLLERQRLLRTPRRPVVDRAEDACADPGPRVELLDRRVRSVRDDGARVDQRTKRVRPARVAGPEAVSEIAVRG